ncbi:MAG: hypothetical protein ACP5N1_06070 [Candidatus Woesearchaeota archaeon]
MRKKALKNNEDKKVEDKKITIKKTAKNSNTSVSSTLSETASLAKQKDLPDSLGASNKDTNKDMVSSPIQTLKLYFNVPSDKSFILCDGRKILNCKELADALLIIGDDLFGYHVNDNKNDFANWINDVFEDHNLAKKIGPIKNRLEMSIIIYKHIFELLERG